MMNREYVITNSYEWHNAGVEHSARNMSLGYVDQILTCNVWGPSYLSLTRSKSLCRQDIINHDTDRVK